ncbi:probable cyclin-dependent serine/threonine-protein kinase DDB_G0292550 [Ctenocephalides felis]|uniref:probable cyclin-dependent serine/threonine-protein kinase DDB_G0292550 n=1 Tax=Ctenocephalides felis TaxID=7515 RepID=UPI000E6E58E7|nr:probable cyclin-dependent serine/threonine-protein kinase DDB_G0292550 [Ctenocephalides felis]
MPTTSADVVAYTTDENGNVIGGTVENGNLIITTDKNENLITTTDENGNSVGITDVNGNLITATIHQNYASDTTEANENTIAITNENGNLINTTDENGNSIGITDVNGNLISVTSHHDYVSDTTDENGNSIASAENENFINTADENGNLFNDTDANENSIAITDRIENLINTPSHQDFVSNTNNENGNSITITAESGNLMSTISQHDYVSNASKHENSMITPDKNGTSDINGYANNYGNWNFSTNNDENLIDDDDECENLFDASGEDYNLIDTTNHLHNIVSENDENSYLFATINNYGNGNSIGTTNKYENFMSTSHNDYANDTTDENGNSIGVIGPNGNLISTITENGNSIGITDVNGNMINTTDENGNSNSTTSVFNETENMTGAADTNEYSIGSTDGNGNFISTFSDHDYVSNTEENENSIVTTDKNETSEINGYVIDATDNYGNWIYATNNYESLYDDDDECENLIDDFNKNRYSMGADNDEQLDVPLSSDTKTMNGGALGDNLKIAENKDSGLSHNKTPSHHHNNDGKNKIDSFEENKNLIADAHENENFRGAIDEYGNMAVVDNLNKIADSENMNNDGKLGVALSSDTKPMNGGTLGDISKIAENKDSGLPLIFTLKDIIKIKHYALLRRYETVINEEKTSDLFKDILHLKLSCNSSIDLKDYFGPFETIYETNHSDSCQTINLDMNFNKIKNSITHLHNMNKLLFDRKLFASKENYYFDKIFAIPKLTSNCSLVEENKLRNNSSNDMLFTALEKIHYTLHFNFKVFLYTGNTNPITENFSEHTSEYMEHRTNLESETYVRERRNAELESNKSNTIDASRKVGGKLYLMQTTNSIQ